MKIGIIGSGIVGATLGTKLIQLNHEVKISSRIAYNEKATKWVNANGEGASEGAFADAAAFGEIIFICTKGDGTMDALKAAGTENLDGKILIDVSNPLDFSHGMPPSLFPSLSNTNSLGEEIQRTYPKSKVVKALNTMNCNLMVNPTLIGDSHDLFICGNDETAKSTVAYLLKSFGWVSIIDLGDITGARAMEMILPLWVRLMMKYKSPNFNFKIVK